MSSKGDFNNVRRISMGKYRGVKVINDDKQGSKNNEIEEKESSSKCSLTYIRSKPIIEILSVSLCNDYSNPSVISQESWEICGVIYVYDDRGNICFIYERGGIDAKGEIVPSVGGPLSLTGPDEVISMDSPHIYVDICDKVTGETIVDGSAQLFKTIDTAKQNHQFEQIKTAAIAGNGCCANVVYLALTFGAFAKVEVQLCAGEEGFEQPELEVYGTIYAEYDLYSSENKINIDLLKAKEDSCDSKWITLDAPINLSRSVVAVPAYSSVTIQVSLWSRANNNLIVHGSCEIDILRKDSAFEIIPGANGVNAKVTIDWSEPFNLNFDSPKVDCYYPSLHTLPDGRYLLSSDIVEVFSLFIGRQNDEQLSLYGTITFSGNGVNTIFKRDKDDPYILLPGCNLLHHEGKGVLIPGDFFIVSVDLKDVEGRVSIKGYVAPGVGTRKKLDGWVNRLFCGVIKDVGRGRHSFAAVHYAWYSKAIRAILKVHFFSKSEQFPSTDACFRIYGSLVACYGAYENRSNYEQLYHRIVLFERTEQNPLKKLGSFFELELIRSVVAVPLGSPLHIVVDLTCCLSTGFSGCVNGILKIGVGTNNMEINEDEFGVNVTVEWKGAR